MPSTGLLSFLPRCKYIFCGAEKDRVNALNGLTFISTMTEDIFTSEVELCQCPQRAYFHFYSSWKKQRRKRRTVSMPSTGLLSFLLNREEFMSNHSDVSMPSTGLLSFLRYPLGTLDFSGFRELFLQVINRIFCKLLFLLLFLCLSKNLSAHTLLSYALIALLSINSYYNFQIVTIQRLAGHEKTDGVD